MRDHVNAESDRAVADGFVPETDDRRPKPGEPTPWSSTAARSATRSARRTLARELREEGPAVGGGTPTTVGTEDGRGVSTFEAGVQFVEDDPGADVVSPGAVQKAKRRRYVGCEDDVDDVVGVPGPHRKTWTGNHPMKGALLQRRGEGIEVADSGLFDGGRFVEPKASTATSASSAISGDRRMMHPGVPNAEPGSPLPEPQRWNPSTSCSCPPTPH